MDRTPDDETGGVVLPEHVSVAGCLYCGALGGAAACASCTEHRIDLVAAQERDALAGLALAAAGWLGRLEPVARRLAAGPPADGAEEAWRRLHEKARLALATPRTVLGEPPGVVTAWWCSACGNVDLPRPCIGACTWVQRDWVRRDVYERERAPVAAALGAAAAYAGLIALLAAVTPRPGRADANWRALGARAAALLARNAWPPPPAGDHRPRDE